jgi:hypothetical protein
MARQSQERARQEFAARIAAISTPEFIGRHVTGALAEAREGGCRPEEVEVVTIQNDGTGPATVAYRVAGVATLFGKLYRDSSGVHAWEVLRRLWLRGFHAGGRYQVAEPLGFLPQHNLLLMRAAGGACLASSFGDANGGALDGIREAARWLARLHSSPVRIGELDQPWYVFAKLTQRLAKAAAAHAGDLKRLTGMVDRLEELADGGPKDVVQVHGQFRPIHVFLTDQAVTVIDLDRSKVSDPAWDLAEFLHRLRSSLYRAGGAIGQANRFSHAFLEEYATRRPTDLKRVRFYHGFHVVVSLCRHMKRASRDDPEWESGVNFYLEEWERALAGSN